MFVERSWIQSIGGEDLAQTSCGEIAQVFDNDTDIQIAEGSLANGENGDLWEVDVPTNADLLRVAINGELGTGQDFHLYVRRGAAPTIDPFVADCFSVTAGTLDHCAISQAQAGTYWILVQRVTGTGEYQLTATAFGLETDPPPPPPPPPPPNGPDAEPCFRSVSTACLLDDRFEVKVKMKDFSTPPVLFVGRVQTYSGASSETDQSVSFYSFQEGNVESS